MTGTDGAKRVLALRDDLAGALKEMETLFLDDEWADAAELLIVGGWIAVERPLPHKPSRAEPVMYRSERKAIRVAQEREAWEAYMQADKFKEVL